MRPQHSTVLGAVVLASLVVMGCSHKQSTPSWSPTAAAVATEVTTDATLEEPTSLAAVGELVDLRPGRESRLDRVFRIQDVLPDGSLVTAFEIHSIVVSRITGTETHAGRTYFVEDRTVQEDGGPVLPYTHSPFRQDRSGLYFFQPEETRDARPTIETGDADQPGLASNFPADLTAAWVATAGRPEAWRATLARRLQTVALVRALAAGAPSRASFAGTSGGVATLAGPPGGALADEVTLLRYPLHPGATWDGLVGFNVWTVEAVGNTVLPIGRTWTARLDISLPGITDDDDKITFWYGAPGEVKSKQHFLDVATDQNGEPIGKFVSEDETLITSYTPGSEDAN
jgi:hypothetical protein